MGQRMLGTLLVGFLFAVSAPPAASDPPSCIDYEPDPRDEPHNQASDLTQADALVIPASALISSTPGTVQMRVEPWTVFHLWWDPGCPDRDYHRQPTGGNLGSGVLVGQDRILTAGHLFESGYSCSEIRFVFGFGKFDPDQWPITCSPSDPELCWVTVPAQDVYSCASAEWVYIFGVEDWGVAVLDRDVQGRTPLPILRDPDLYPADEDPVTVVGHPNRIPMKVEHVPVDTDQCPYCIDAHILQGSSGSMVVDDGSGKVIGIVVQYAPAPSGEAGIWILPDCGPSNPNVCYREWFSNPYAGAKLNPAWDAADEIPEL